MYLKIKVECVLNESKIDFKILGNWKVYNVNWKKKIILLVFVLLKKNLIFFKLLKYIYVLYMYVGEDYFLYLLIMILYL